MLVIAASLGAVSAVAGIYASYYLDLSTGAAVVLAQALLFLAAYLFAPRDGVLVAARRQAVAA
jgi:manganese transport system permease protein